MTEQNPPRDDEPSSPFPESSLGGQPEAPPEHPQADPAPPADLQPPGPEPEPAQHAPAEPPPSWPQPAAEPPVQSGAGAWTESTGPAPAGGGEWTQPGEPGAGSSLWADHAPEQPQPQPQYAPPVPPPAPGGFTTGDPLGGSAYPQGYTSPPPPGAVGMPPPPVGAPPAYSTTPSPGSYVLSGWWRRVGAAVIDGLIIFVLAIVIMAPLGIGLFSLDENDESGFFVVIGGLILTGLVIAIIALAYAPVMMGATNGKTLGRMATGIRVIRADGQPMTFGWAALREVAVKTLLINVVAGSFTFGLAGLLDVLWPLWDDQNRALHDFVVNTRTIID